MNEKLDMALFAQRLKQARNSKELTQKELSDLSGVSTVMISQYERSEISTGKNPALNNVYSLANALGVSIDWLCGLTGKSRESGISTMTFLHATETLIDNIDERYFERDRCLSRPYDGFERVCSINIPYGSDLYNLIEEYINIMPARQYLSDDLQETIIGEINKKYADKSIKELLSDIDDLPFD